MDQTNIDDIYRDRVILDHCRNPRNTLPVERCDLSGDAVNPFCGDEVHFQISLSSKDLIENVSFAGDGCAINMASGSLLSEAVKGLTIGEASELSIKFVESMRKSDDLSVDHEFIGELSALISVKHFPVRIKCALLAWSALEDALST
ncbi:MAG: SUF system NifU family Fe-S cluster assembly protein [Chloroflexi bacterium]|nr:SUF system NifU family Fe-S cluster assembly protein [Chloroflexota bacterium]|tara:strand:+ start:4253 stop:4693 length:441 start_codon:yes stop_codon:yes gene_type:complete